jgi:hypothetical protein
MLDNAVPTLDPNDPDLLDKVMDWTEGQRSTPNWNRPLRNANRNPEVRAFFLSSLLRTTYPEQLERRGLNVRFAAVEDIRDGDAEIPVGAAKEVDQNASDYVDPFAEQPFVQQSPQWAYIDPSAFGVREDDMVWQAPKRSPPFLATHGLASTVEDVDDNQAEQKDVASNAESPKGRSFSDRYSAKRFDLEVEHAYKLLQARKRLQKENPRTPEPGVEVPPPVQSATTEEPSISQSVTSEASDLFSEEGRKRTEERQRDRQRARAFQDKRDEFRGYAMETAREEYGKCMNLPRCAIETIEKLIEPQSDSTQASWTLTLKTSH